jgi:hypothetical protein
MTDRAHDPQEEFADEQGHEFQKAHYHDEDPEIADDEDVVRKSSALPGKKKSRIPPPRPHYDED